MTGKKRTRQTPEERNAMRRARYRDDPEYRERAIKSTRAGYRARKVLVDRSTCLDNLTSLPDIGTRRLVEVDGDTRMLVTFNLGEVSSALNRRPEVVSRWIKNDLFPRPGFTLAKPARQNSKVFTYEQVRHYVAVMGEHQKETPYYRVEHFKTRQRLFEAGGSGD